MPKDKKLFSKIIMILFLLMVVIGFTIPLFNLGGNTADQPQQAEPRLCRTDADCYLICDDVPLTVLCTQNLCQQNSCEEGSIFMYQEQPTAFTLSVTIEGETIDFASRQDEKNLFVKFSDDDVQMHASLSLPLVLEKAGIMLQGQCLLLDGQSYCTDEEKELSVQVNGQPEAVPQYYYPQEGDVVEVEYS